MNNVLWKTEETVKRFLLLHLLHFWLVLMQPLLAMDAMTRKKWTLRTKGLLFQKLHVEFCN